MNSTCDFGRYKDRELTTGCKDFEGMHAAKILGKEETDIPGFSSKDRIPEFYSPEKTTKYIFTLDGKRLHKISSEASIVKETTSETTKNYQIKRAAKLLISSGKFKIVKANQLFDIKNIDRDITLRKFKMLRKKSNVPIEDYLLKERYE